MIACEQCAYVAVGVVAVVVVGAVAGTEEDRHRHSIDAVVPAVGDVNVAGGCLDNAVKKLEEEDKADVFAVAVDVA